MKRLLGISLIFALLLGLMGLGVTESSYAAGRMQHPSLSRGTPQMFFIPQGVNPSLHDPFHTLYDWKIDHNPYDEPCHYDEDYGQWVGPCNSSLDQPGFSITVPNRIRK